MTSLEGKKVGAYRLGEKIGEGGMAEVYRATHPTYGTVAFKILLPALATDPGARRRFLREAEAIRGFRHPQIIRLHESGTERDPLHKRGELSFIAMEYLGGGTLAEHLHERRISQGQMLSIGLMIGNALDHAHARGVIHRDLKAGNILFRADGTPVLCDFGIAYASDHTKMTRTGAVTGTIAYMAPELLDGTSASASERSDIYALGLILYEALSGTRPFHGNDISLTILISRVLTLVPPPLRASAPGIAEPVAELIDRSISKSPAERPQSAAAFVAALREAGVEPLHARADLPTQVDALAAQPAPPARRVDAQPRQVRRKLIGLAGGAGLFAAVGLGAMLTMAN
ncbi:MAG TPA: serine/threonine-protein kinase, partial [Herpetosiphonaceae bacterium]